MLFPENACLEVNTHAQTFLFRETVKIYKSFAQGTQDISMPS